MSHKLGALLACAVAGMLSAVTAPAHALSCGEPGVHAPAYGASEVPTNTLVWCSRSDPNDVSAVRVLDPAGLPVSGTSTLLSARHFRLTVFRPDAELEPHTQYRVDCQPDAAPRAFTTGAGPRSQAPAAPALGNMTVYAVDDPWGPSLGVGLREVSPSGTIVLLDLQGAAELDAAGLSGTISDAKLMGAPDVYLVGRGGCTRSWPGAELGAATRFRLAAFDLTGAFSGWTDWQTVTLPEQFAAPEDEETQLETPTASGPAQEQLPGTDGEQTLGGTGALVTDVVGAERASDGAAPPVKQSSGCQLGARTGTSWAAGLLAALACSGALRKRRNARRRA